MGLSNSPENSRKTSLEPEAPRHMVTDGIRGLKVDNRRYAGEVSGQALRNTTPADSVHASSDIAPVSTDTKVADEVRAKLGRALRTGK